MIKKFGLTIGGLQQKIFNLVLVFVIIIGIVVGGISFYQYSLITELVSSTNEEQQESISAISANTMSQVIDGSMTKSNALQAYIAGDMFTDLKTDVVTLQTLATGLFEHMDSFEPHAFAVPDPANEGIPSAQVLWERGVNYESSEYLGVAAHMTDTMIAMYTSNDMMSTVYFGLADGTNLCIDEHSSNKFDEDGNILNFPVRERPWYTGAAESGGVWFSDVYSDSFTGILCITCSAPVYAGGKLVGVIGADLFLDSMSDYINSSLGDGGFICVINSNGHVIFAPENNGLFNATTAENAEDLRASANAELASFITDSLAGTTGVRTVKSGDTEYYMVGSPIGSVGWAAVSVVDKALTEQPTQLMIAEYEKINNNATETFRSSSQTAEYAVLAILAAVLVIGTIIIIKFSGRIVKPLERMTAHIAAASSAGDMFEMYDTYRTGDEIEELAKAFADLSGRTVQYIDHIQKITAEKERIGAELSLATSIQAGMLPNMFPAFPERPEFDIYASMDPAKEVGGDFYDFFMIDDDHLAMVIGDVSGKGVPAALFMMASKITINDHALMGGTPAEILQRVNKQICSANDAEMFVTVWLGILEISTGKLTAASAGHEYPMLNINGKYELFKDKHGMAVGAMDIAKYKDYEITLKKGDSIFVYTDGVAEATDAQNELFGTDRTLDALNNLPGNDTQEEILKGVRKAVDAFVKEAPQFDDLTMLGLKYYGTGEEK